MDKRFYESKTFWGVLILGVEAGLIALGEGSAAVNAVLSFLGVVLTGYGFRDAL